MKNLFSPLLLLAVVLMASPEESDAGNNPTKFDADAWVRLIKAAGMRYLVFTAKHHDGLAMWDSDGQA